MNVGLNQYHTLIFIKLLADPLHFVARQPIIIIIIDSKPIATIYKQKFPSEISKSLFEHLPGLVFSLFKLAYLMPSGIIYLKL